MAPSDAPATFSLFPRTEPAQQPQPSQPQQPQPQHRRRPSSKPSSKPAQDTTAALSAMLDDAFKPGGSDALSTVPEERSNEHSPSSPHAPPPAAFPPTHIGSTLRPPAVLRSRTPSPPRLQTSFPGPTLASSPPKAKKPALRTSQLVSQPWSLPVSPPPSEGLPPLPAHVSPPRTAVTTSTASPASPQSPSLNMSPSSVKPPSSATTTSPTSPASQSAAAARALRSKPSTASSISSPQSITSPQFSFSPSLIVPASGAVSYPSVPPAQSPPMAAKHPRARSKAAPKEKSLPIPPPPPGSPPTRPRRPSHSESTYSGTTALSTSAPAHPSKSLFPTYDPNLSLQQQARNHRPQHGYYAPTKVPSLRHAPSSPNLASSSSSAPRLTASALQQHALTFDAPPISAGRNAITRANTAPRSATPAPLTSRASTAIPAAAQPSKLPVPRSAEPQPHDEALLSKSWGALTFVVGVGVEVAAGAVGGLKKGVQKERAKRELKREKTEMKREREERKRDRGRSRWVSGDDAGAGGEGDAYAGRIVEITARAKGGPRGSGVEHKMDFRI